MSHLPLLEVTSDLVKFSPAVVSHLVQEDDTQVNIIGKVAKNGNIAAIAKVDIIANSLDIDFDIAGGQP